MDKYNTIQYPEKEMLNHHLFQMAFQAVCWYTSTASVLVSLFQQCSYTCV